MHVFVLAWLDIVYATTNVKLVDIPNMDYLQHILIEKNY